MKDVISKSTNYTSNIQKIVFTDLDLKDTFNNFLLNDQQLNNLYFLCDICELEMNKININSL
jgi:hypothetical protein